MAIVDQKRSALPGALRDGASRTGCPRSATSTPTSTRSRPSSSGRGSGRWRAGSRRSREPRDFVEYEILDQSVIVRAHRRHASVRAFQNACRHRGVQARRGPRHVRERLHAARSTAGATASTARTPPSPQRTHVRRAQPACRTTSTSCRCGARRGAAARGSTSTTTRRRCASASSRRHDPRRVEGRVAAHRVVVRVPPPGELEARASRRSSSCTTWCETHPQLVIPDAVRRRATGTPFDPRAFIDADIQYLRTMSDGMAGMVPRQRRARRRGPARHRAARPTPTLAIGDVEPHAQRRRRALAPRRRATTSPTSTSSTTQGINLTVLPRASRTTSCCRCTAARRRTASARSGRRRR